MEELKGAAPKNNFIWVHGFSGMRSILEIRAARLTTPGPVVE
jgi:hypothetical protein